MNSDQTRIRQSMLPAYTIHQAGKPAVVNTSINTNPGISATCTVTADGGILPLYFIYPESQIKHVPGNSVKQQQRQASKVTITAPVTNSVSGTNNSVTNHNNNNSNNVTNNNTTNHIHIHLPDTDKHSNFYTITKGGSMTQERLLILLIK